MEQDYKDSDFNSLTDGNLLIEEPEVDEAEEAYYRSVGIACMTRWYWLNGGWAIDRTGDGLVNTFCLLVKESYQKPSIRLQYTYPNQTAKKMSHSC